MQAVTILRHIACEGPGYLEGILEKNHIPVKLIAIDRGEQIPQTLEESCGLIIMGGPMSVNDSDDWIQQEIGLIRWAIDHDCPLLGHCLGGQFIAKALGAEVVKNPVKEIGWLPVTTTPTNRTKNWLELFHQPQQVFHWHGETFSLPDGAELLLSSEHCRHQAFSYKTNVLAFQCHIEMTTDMIDEWTTVYADEISSPEDTIQSRSEILEKTGQHIMQLNRMADTIYTDWIKYLE